MNVFLKKFHCFLNIRNIALLLGYLNTILVWNSETYPTEGSLRPRSCRGEAIGLCGGAVSGLWKSSYHPWWGCHYRHYLFSIQLSPFWEPWIALFAVLQLLRTFLLFVNLNSHVLSGGLCLHFQEKLLVNLKSGGWSWEVDKREIWGPLFFNLWNKLSSVA